MKKTLLTLSLTLVLSRAVSGADSFAPLENGKVPQTPQELWAGYDPSREPLDVKILQEWKGQYEGKDITTQLLTYTVGTFKGQASRMAAYYAFPSGATGKVPGLVEIHGGGQTANRGTVEQMAANGYACISINWGARPLPELKPGDPNTDWGAVDATQTTHGGSFFTIAPDPKTIDTVPSPRNNNWFLVTIAGRRALTFLEQQPVVDSARLGVFGHSMGGILTTMVTGTDPRVEVSVPSVGGSGDFVPEDAKRPGAGYRDRIKEALYFATVDEAAVIPNIKCPILYMGPHNDFNCNYDLLNVNWRKIPANQVHFSISPHLNHRHIDEAEFTRVHFLNTVLLGDGKFPATPKLEVNLKTTDGVPVATLSPDSPDQARNVQIYYSVNPHALTRFWRRAETIREGDHWTAKLPVTSTSMPLFVMGNVFYPLPKPLIGPPYLRKSPENFLVSSWEQVFEPKDLQAAGVKETSGFAPVIQETFEDWGDWYRLGPKFASTRKLTDPKWMAPDGAELAIDILDPEGGDFLVVFEVNQWSAYANLKTGKYYALVPLQKSPDWQTIKIPLSEVKPVDPKTPPISSWQGITELTLTAGEGTIKAAWPDSRQFRNLRWEGGTHTKPPLMPGGNISEEEYKRLFQQSIDQSVQLEKKDAAKAATPAVKPVVAKPPTAKPITATPVINKPAAAKPVTTTPAAAQQPPVLRSKQLDRYDSNKDGVVSREEYRLAWENQFKVLDRNADGKLVREEWNNAIFKNFDKDNSNFVEKQEWDDGNLFNFDNHMDLNKDGVATPVTEWKNWQ